MRKLLVVLLPKNGFATVTLLVTLLSAAFLRLYKINEYMTFLGDEGRDALTVYNILHGKFTLLGPTASVGGFFHGPIYYYFMAPFLWIFRYDPVGPAIMVAIVGTLVVFLIYKIGSIVFNEKAGLFAAMLYAVSPVVIAYSRSSWNPNLMPFFSLVTLFLLYRAIRENKKSLFVLVGILLGISIQLHYIITFLGIIVFFYTFVMSIFSYKSKGILVSIRSYLLLFVGFLIGFSPFLLFEIRHGFQNIQNIARFIISPSGAGGGETYQIARAMDVLYRLFGRLITTYPPPEQVSIQAHADIAIWFYLTLLLLSSSIVYFAYNYYLTWRVKSEKFYQYSLFFFWGSIGILLFGFYKKSIYDYYFQFMFPLPFFWVGYMLSGVTSIRTKSLSLLGKCTGFLVVGILLVINLSKAPFFFVPNRQKDQVKEIAEFVLEKTEGKPFNFALLTLGNSDHAYRYFFTVKDRVPATIETVANDPERKTVTDQLLIVCEDPNCQPLGSPLWEVAGFGRAEITGQWAVSVVKVYKLKHYKEK